MTTRHYILYTLILLTTQVSFGQTEEYMQIVRERIEKRNPTMVNDTSSLNKLSGLAGYTLVVVKPSPCNETLMGEPIKERVARKEYKNDTLDIDVAIIANCCSSFLGEIQIKDDTTLNIIFTEYGDECMCTCCFQLTYQIATKNDNLTSFQLNGKPVIETDQVLREKKTEKEYYDNGNVRTMTYKLDDDVIYVFHYNEEGKRIQTDYYREGELVKEVKK